MSLKDKVSRIASYFVAATAPPKTTPSTVPPILVDPPTHTVNGDGDAISRNAPFDGEEGSPCDGFSREAGVGESESLPPKTVEQIVRESDGPNLDEIRVSFGESIPTLPDGTLDYAAIYGKAGLPTPPFTAEQLIQMLRELPGAMPPDMKRQTVKVTISTLGKHIGVSTETIVADASRKVAALAAFESETETHTRKFVAATEAEIAALLAQVEEKRRSVTNATQRLAAVQQSCEREAERLDEVLGFFSQDLPGDAVETNPAAIVVEEEDDTPPTIPLPRRPPALPILTGDTNPDAPIPPTGSDISLSWEEAPVVEAGPPTETPPPLPISTK